MKKALKIVGSVCAVLMVLVVITVLLLPTLVDLNDYRTRIETVWGKATGLPMHIQGKIKASIWPNLGFSVADVQVDDTSGSALATLKSTQVQVKLWPLLHKRIELVAVNIDGVTLNIIKNQQGIGNWEPITNPATDKGVKQSSPKPATTQTTQIEFEFRTAQVNMTHVNIAYQDQQTGQKFAIDSAKLSLQGSLKTTFALKGAIPLQLSHPKWQGTLALAAQLGVQKDHYQLNDLSITVQSAHQGQLRIQGNLAWIAQKLQGQLSLKAHQLGTWLGYANNQTLADITASVGLRGDFSQLRMEPIHIRVDDQPWEGQLQLKNWIRAIPQVRFTLSGKVLNVDRYLPAKTKQDKTDTAVSEKTQVVQSVSTHGLSDAQIHTLRQLDLKGSVQVGKLIVAKIPFDQLALQLTAERGLLQLQNVKAQVLSGNLSGSAKLDVRHVPTVSTDLTLNAIGLAPLGALYGNPDVMDGRFNGQVALATAFAPDTWLSGLNGHAQFSVKEGAVYGVNANKLVCQAIAAVHHEKLQKKNWPEKTQFNTLQGSATIRQGVVYNNDLSASLEQLNLSGQGQVSLARQSLDYHIALSAAGKAQDTACTINKKYRAMVWPVRCQGRFNHNNLCAIDATLLAKEIAKLAQKELTDKLPDYLKDKLDKGTTDLLQKWLH